MGFFGGKMGLGFFLTDLRNGFDFFLRERLSFSRKGYSESGLDLDRELSLMRLGDAQLTEDLVERYRFAPYLAHLSKQSFLDNIVHLMLLDSLAKYVAIFPDGKVLDVGSKNFAYCVAIYEFLRARYRAHNSFPADEALCEVWGVEIDVHRRYSNLHTRRSCAEYYSRLIPGAKFIQGDILHAKLSGPFPLITHFYPFVELYSLLDFGLPSRHYKPLEIFRRIFQMLEPGGQYILANTTKDEYLHSRSLLEACQFCHVGSGSVCNGLTNNKPIYASIYYK